MGASWLAGCADCQTAYEGEDCWPGVEGKSYLAGHEVASYLDGYEDCWSGAVCVRAGCLSEKVGECWLTVCVSAD